jgi:hypothetical protein
MSKCLVIKKKKPPQIFIQLLDDTGYPANFDSGCRRAREVPASCLASTAVSCRRIVADFRFIDEFERNIAEPYTNDQVLMLRFFLKNSPQKMAKKLAVFNSKQSEIMQKFDHNIGF